MQRESCSVQEAARRRSNCCDNTEVGKRQNSSTRDQEGGPTRKTLNRRAYCAQFCGTNRRNEITAESTGCPRALELPLLSLNRDHHIPKCETISNYPYVVTLASTFKYVSTILHGLLDLTFADSFALGNALHLRRNCLKLELTNSRINIRVFYFGNRVGHVPCQLTSCYRGRQTIFNLTFCSAIFICFCKTYVV